LKGFKQIDTIKGSELIGRRYLPLFPFFSDAANSFAVFSGDFVRADEGTGIVHIAPGFGEEDLELGKSHGMPVIIAVDAAGAFTDQVPDYAGQNVILEANGNIIHDLKLKGVVVRHEQYRHNYPHCWRTDQPLIYMAINSWYLEASRFRDRMTDLNGGIHWVPGHFLAIGWPTPATGTFPVIDSGARRSRFGRATIRDIHASTFMARSTRSREISAFGLRICTGR